MFTNSHSEAVRLPFPTLWTSLMFYHNSQCKESAFSPPCPATGRRQSDLSEASNRVFRPARNIPRSVHLLLVPPRLPQSLLFLESGTKTRHFQKLHEKTGIPYTEMVSCEGRVCTCSTNTGRSSTMTSHATRTWNPLVRHGAVSPGTPLTRFRPQV